MLAFSSQRGRRLLRALQLRWRSGMAYPLLVTRRRGTDAISRADVVVLLLLLVANVLSCTIGVADAQTITTRSGLVAMINLVPLALGGRTNVVLDHVFRVDRGWTEKWHRWVGRVCLLEGVVHGLTARAAVTGADASTCIRLIVSDLPRAPRLALPDASAG